MSRALLFHEGKTHRSGAAAERVCRAGGLSKLQFLISCASEMFEI